jgi:hypothetical protein
MSILMEIFLFLALFGIYFDAGYFGSRRPSQNCKTPEKRSQRGDPGELYEHLFARKRLILVESMTYFIAMILY